MHVHQDAAVYAALVAPGEALTHRFRPGFWGYLFVVHGSAEVDGSSPGGMLDEGGAAKVQDETEITVRGGEEGVEVLLVETRAVRDR